MGKKLKKPRFYHVMQDHLEMGPRMHYPYISLRLAKRLSKLMNDIEIERLKRFYKKKKYDVNIRDTYYVVEYIKGINPEDQITIMIAKEKQV